MSFESWTDKSTLLIQHAQHTQGTSVDTIYVLPKKGITFLTQGNAGVLNEDTLVSPCPSGWFGATTMYPITTANYYDSSTEQYESSDLISQVKIWDPTKKASVRIDVESESSEVSVVRTLTISGSGTEDEGDLIYEIIVKAYQSTIYGKMTLYADIYNSVNDISDRRLTLLSSKSEEAHAYLSVDGVGTTNNPRKLLLEDSSFNVKEGSIFTQDYDSDQEDYSIYTTDGDISTKTGDVYSSSGDLYSETGDINCKAGSLIIGKNLVSNSFSYTFPNSSHSYSLLSSDIKSYIRVSPSTENDTINIFIQFSTILELNESIPDQSRITIYNYSNYKLILEFIGGSPSGESTPGSRSVDPMRSINIIRNGYYLNANKYYPVFNVLDPNILDSSITTVKVADESVTLAKIDSTAVSILKSKVTYNINRVIQPSADVNELLQRYFVIDNTQVQGLLETWAGSVWKMSIDVFIATGLYSLSNITGFRVVGSDNYFSTASWIDSTNEDNVSLESTVNSQNLWVYTGILSGDVDGRPHTLNVKHTTGESTPRLSFKTGYTEVANVKNIILFPLFSSYIGGSQKVPVSINATITFERVS
jgi:hypothetical protein